MRHNKKVNHLGRQSGHRKAMMSNMASSLILHKRIETTTAKAKALKKFVEPLITKSKEDTTHSRRTVFSYLKDKQATAELFREVAPKIANRPGGYTRILKTYYRVGDAAEMCIIELVDFNETYVAGAVAAKTTRRSRGGAKKATTAETTAIEPPIEGEAIVGEAAEAPKPAEKKVAAKKAAPAKKATPKATTPKNAPKVSTASKASSAKTGRQKV